MSVGRGRDYATWQDDMKHFHKTYLHVTERFPKRKENWFSPPTAFRRVKNTGTRDGERRYRNERLDKTSVSSKGPTPLSPLHLREADEAFHHFSPLDEGRRRRVQADAGVQVGAIETFESVSPPLSQGPSVVCRRVKIMRKIMTTKRQIRQSLCFHTR